MPDALTWAERFAALLCGVCIACIVAILWLGVF